MNALIRNLARLGQQLTQSVRGADHPAHGFSHGLSDRFDMSRKQPSFAEMHRSAEGGDHGGGHGGPEPERPPNAGGGGSDTPGATTVHSEATGGGDPRSKSLISHQTASEVTADVIARVMAEVEKDLLADPPATFNQHSLSLSREFDAKGENYLQRATELQRQINALKAEQDDVLRCYSMLTHAERARL